LETESIHTPYRNTVFPLRDKRSGFTFIQLMVVLVVMGIMAVSIKPLSKSIAEVMKQRAAVSAVKQTVLAARARAMANPMTHCGVYFGFSSTSPRVRLFEDTDNPTAYLYDSTVDGNYGLPVALSKGVKLDSIPGYPRYIIFRGDGSAYLSAKIQIKTGSRIDTLDVLASTGRVKVYR